MTPSPAARAIIDQQCARVRDLLDETGMGAELTALMHLSLTGALLALVFRDLESVLDKEAASAMRLRTTGWIYFNEVR